jgi:tRNA (guanine-N7-)-methyltransferase
MPPRVRVRHHVNPLRSEYMHIAPPPLAPLKAPASSPSSTPSAPGSVPLEVELGCADAQFLFQLARRDPHTRYVGVEIRRPHVDDVNQRAAEEGLDRLSAVFAHINLDLPGLFAGHPVRRFYINFPDPWFKRAQHKRRIVTPELVDTLLSLLEPQGEIFFQSDVFDLALDAMAVLESEPRIVNASPRGEWSFFGENPFPARSLREDRVTAHGDPVWRVLYRRSER